MENQSQRFNYQVSWEDDLTTTTTKKEHKLKYWGNKPSLATIDGIKTDSFESKCWEINYLDIGYTQGNGEQTTMDVSNIKRPTTKESDAKMKGPLVGNYQGEIKFYIVLTFLFLCCM